MDFLAAVAKLFQSTYPLRGTSVCGVFGVGEFFVSIHVPREGYVHARSHQISLRPAFQSTYPVRGTSDEQVPYDINIFVSIHVPREGYVFSLA